MNRAIVPFPSERWPVVRLVSSVVGLVALVVAAPIALSVLGGMPFSHAGVVAISHSLTSRQAGDPRLVSGWITSSVLVLAWLAWAWLSVCVVVELRSWITGRTPMRLPASRTMQSVAAFLVGTALALATAGRLTPTPRQASVAATNVVPVSRVGIPNSVGPVWSVALSPDRFPDGVVPMSLLVNGLDAESADRPHLQGAGSPSPVLGQIRPRTSAERRRFRGGDGQRSMTSVEGGGRAPGEAREAFADAPPDADQVDRLAVPKTHLVRTRETLWSIAEDELGTALRWNELAEYNYGITQADGQSLDERHWVVPGWRLLLPPTSVGDVGTGTVVRETVERPMARPTPTEGTELVPPGLPVNRASVLDRTPEPLKAQHVPPGSTRTARESARINPLTPPRPFTPSVPVVPLGGGVVGAGVVRLLDRLRQVQQRHRPVGSYIRLPDRDQSRFEQRLRVGDGVGLTAEVDAAIRWATSSGPRWLRSRP